MSDALSSILYIHTVWDMSQMRVAVRACDGETEDNLLIGQSAGVITTVAAVHRGDDRTDSLPWRDRGECWSGQRQCDSIDVRYRNPMMPVLQQSFTVRGGYSSRTSRKFCSDSVRCVHDIAPGISCGEAGVGVTCLRTNRVSV